MKDSLLIKGAKVLYRGISSVVDFFTIEDEETKIVSSDV